MHRVFVFRASQTDRATNLRYVAVMALAFAANQAMLTLLGGLVGPAPIARAAAQMAAIVTYTALQFVLMRVWVFRPRPL
jgi:putative flippase GtrA